MEEFSETPAIVFIIIGNSLLNTDTKNKKKLSHRRDNHITQS